MSLRPPPEFDRYDWLKLPHAEAGNRVGIFGGSFNPPHSGHRLVAETALRRLGLDQLWWLVTPGNPLKDHSDLAPLEGRVKAVREIAQHPRMKVTAAEVLFGSSYTARTVKILKQRRPDLKLVWVMGADSLVHFHKWQAWKSIVEAVPIAIVNRPGASLAPLYAPMPTAYRDCRISEEDAGLIPDLAAPAWVFLHSRLDPASSTDLRTRR